MSTNRYALLSVTDKTNLEPFAQTLRVSGYTLISTGGTAKYLREAGLTVVEVSSLTGLPEMFDGRVKTLHPRVFAGILVRSLEKDQETLAELGWEAIDMVVVNLYDFRSAAAAKDRSMEQVIESIDIGGPSLLRAAAKNAERVTAVCDPADYLRITKAMENPKRQPSLHLRLELAQKVFKYTAEYDTLVAAYLAEPLLQLRLARALQEREKEL